MPWAASVGQPVGLRRVPWACRRTTAVWFTLGDVPYEVQTPVFEGPFDLLLHLILREQVDLYEVSLSRHRRRLPGRARAAGRTLDLDVATEFLLIAATLVELKARRLLPGDDDVDLDEELALWEERDLLLARLLECKTFKDAAVVLAGLADDAGPVVAPPGRARGALPRLAPDLLAGVTPDDLRAAFLRASAPRSRCPGSTSTTSPRSGSA